MKTARRPAPAPTPGRPASPPRRRRLAPPRAAPELPFRSPQQRRWFEAEVAASARLVHTARLAGDFVGAQHLERELGSFIEAARALLEAKGANLERAYHAYDEPVGDPER